MSEEAIKIFDYIGEKFGIVIDYTQENIQPYLEDLWHRFITYEIVVHSAWTFIGIAGIIICSYFIIRYFKASKNLANNIIDPLYYTTKYSYYTHEEYIGHKESGMYILIIATTLAAILTLITIFQISDLIELLILPEKFILQLIKTTQ